MKQQRSRVWRVAERLRLVEERGLRPLGSRAWWLRLALGAGVGVGAALAFQVLDTFQG